MRVHRTKSQRPLARFKEPFVGLSTDRWPGYEGEATARLNRWNAVLSGSGPRDPFKRLDPEPFWLPPSMILQIARTNPPQHAGNTVSDFASWIYSFYSPAPSRVQFRVGRQEEQSIFDARPKAWVDRYMVEPPSTKWRLIHNGLHLANGNDRADYFEIPDLRVGATAIYGSPDLIYLHRETKAAFVVEIKFTRRQIPKNLWPNVWAQLWAYSKLPMLKECTSLRLVGEIWGRNDFRSTGLAEELYLRAVVSRSPTTPAFERFFSTLFAIYADNAPAEA